MRRTNVLVLTLSLLAVCTSNASDPQCSHSGDTGEVDNTQNQRQSFNRAISDKDIRAIENVLHDEVILITGSDSDAYLIQCAQQTSTSLLTLDNGLKSVAQQVGVHVLEAIRFLT